METAKSNHGGKREGAGRKCMGAEKKASLTVRISPSVIDKLDTLAAAQGVSKGVYLENLINKQK